MKSAGTCGPAPGAGTAAASSWSRIIVRTLATVTPSRSAASAQSSHSGTRAARSASASRRARSMRHPVLATVAVRHAGARLQPTAPRAARSVRLSLRILPRPVAGGRCARRPAADGTPARATRAPAGDPLVGRVLDGRYRIGPRIARGGMASVYEATDLRLDRTVAVKVMHPGLGDDDEFAARFVREARARRPALPPQRGRASSTRATTTAPSSWRWSYVPGHTLRDVIRKEAPMPPARALALIEPVLSALAAAHRAGLIHRDVKPENVLIADDGRVKVADFGLAKAVSADTQHTATGGVLIGTVSYLAPELVVDGRADARADVYAAGVVLYELLTGTQAARGRDADPGRLQARARGRARRRRALVPGIPAYVDALVARATARDREPAARRRRRAAPPGAPGQPGARRGRRRRPRADRRPGPATLDTVEVLDARAGRDDTGAGAVRLAAMRRRCSAPAASTPTRSSAPRDTTTVDRTAAAGPRRRPRRRRSSDPSVRAARRPRAWSLLLLALLLAVGGRRRRVVVRLRPLHHHPRRPRADPGRPQAEARGRRARRRGRATRRTPRPSPTGAVISTDPEPGERVLDDGTVTLVGLARHGAVRRARS